MRTKYTILSISLVLSLLTSVQLGAQKVAKKIPVKQTVKFGYIDFAPIFFRTNDGRPDGSFIDIIRYWSHQTKTPIKLVYFDEWKQAVASLEDGSIDMLPGMYRTPEREKRYLFTKPLAVFREDLFIAKKLSRSQMNNATFGVIPETYREKWLRQDYPLAKFKLYKNPKQLISAFSRGTIQVFAMNQNSGLRNLTRIGMQTDNQFRVQPYRTMDSCVAVMPGNEKLISEFNKGLDEIGKKALQSILRAWQVAKIRKKNLLSRPLRIVYAQDIGPYQYAGKNGKAAGFGPDYWRSFSFENSVKIEFIAAKDWSESLAMLKAGKADIHCGLFYSENRSKEFAFSKPYLSSQMALYIDDSISGINGLTDISGFIVGCEKGTLAAKTLLENGLLNKQYNNSYEMLDDFISGKIKAVLMLDELPAQITQHKNKRINYYKVALKKKYSWHGAGLLKNRTLVDWISKLMGNIKSPSVSRKIRMWTIGVPLGQPPMSFATKEGAVLGAVPEFWRLMAERNQYKVRFVIGNWEQLRQWLKDGRIDFIGLSPGSYNEAAWLRSIPFGIVCNQQLFTVSERNPSAGNKYGVLLPASIAAALQYPALRLQTYNSEKKMVEDLKKGFISGFFIDEKLKKKVEAYYILEKPLHPVYGTSFKNNYMLLYASRRGLPREVRETLASPKSIDTFKGIIDKWLAESSLPWKQIITSGVIAIVFLVLLAVWILQLKREIRRRVTITQELREREAELRMQQDQFHMVEHAASMGTWQIDLENRICHFNETAQEMLRLPLDKKEMRFDDEFIANVHPDDQAGILYNIVNNLNAPLLKNTFRYIKPDSDIIWVHAFGRITEYDRDGVPLVLTGFFQDVSARIKAEEESQQQHILIDNLFKNIPFGLACSDPENDFKYTFWNPVMESLTGIKARKAIGHNLIELLPDDYETFNREVAMVMTQQSKVENTKEITLNGNTINVRFCLFPILNHNGKVKLIVTVLEDVTEKVNMEERYRLSQKMEALGRLAGGVAHDFNNFLQTIHGHAEMLRDASLPVPYPDDVTEIINAAERGAALTAQLLIFSHTDSMDKKNIDLNEFASDMYKIIKRLIRADIDFKLQTSDDKINIYGTPGPIGQIVFNLCLNSSDAAAEKDAFINIAISQHHISNVKDIDSPDAKTGRYAMIKVSDNGLGISSAVQKTIFDPFFTTKTPNEGTGMGLATVYAVVKSHGGFIELKSSPGNTEFNIYLPLMEEREMTLQAPSLSAVEDGQTILLAEDDDSIRAMAARILTQAGYQVIEASNGNAAIELYMKNRNRIDLLMTDMVMPGKSGQAACQEVLADNPDLPVIFCSGYSMHELENDFTLNPKNRLLSKPYGIHDLLIAVRDVLGPPGEQNS